MASRGSVPGVRSAVAQVEASDTGERPNPGGVSILGCSRSRGAHACMTLRAVSVLLGFDGFVFRLVAHPLRRESVPLPQVIHDLSHGYLIGRRLPEPIDRSSSGDATDGRTDRPTPCRAFSYFRCGTTISFSRTISSGSLPSRSRRSPCRGSARTGRAFPQVRERSNGTGRDI